MQCQHFAHENMKLIVFLSQKALFYKFIFHIDIKFLIAHDLEYGVHDVRYMVFVRV